MIRLREVSLVALAAGSLGSAAPASAQIATASETEIQTDDIVVTGLRSTATVAKQGIEVRDLPQAITIVPKQVLDEAAARRYEDIVYQTVGLTAVLPYAGAISSGGFSRGFVANQLVNGHAQAYASFASGLAVIDRVEILRGPTSVLYGQGDPGGSVNLVLKQARPQFGFAASATVDTLGTRLADLDVTAPLAGNRLSGRLVAQGEYSTTFRDFEKNRRISVSPILHAEPWDGLAIDAVGSYERYDFTAIRFFFYGPPEEFSIADVKRLPRSINLGEPTLPLSRIDIRTININAEQKLTDTLSIGGFFYSYKVSYRKYFEIFADAPLPGTTLSRRGYTREATPGDDFNRSKTISAYLRGRVSFAGMDHNLYVAAEKVTYAIAFSDLTGDYIPLDIANPVYQDSFAEPPVAPSNLGGQSVSNKAVYANDLISFSDHLKLQLGLRYDKIITTATFDVVPAIFNDHKLSPSAGIVWHPIDSTSLYASYSTSFVPSAGRNRLNEPLKPERSKAYEVGIKQEFFGRRLTATLAVFDITKDDILQSDPDDPTRNSSINGGTARSQGFEIEFEGRPPIPGLSVRGGLAYAHARINKSSDYSPGDKLVGPRPWTGLISARQDLEPLGLSKAWINASLSYGGAQVASIPANGEKIPSFLRIDLAASKQVGPVELQVNLKNLSNQRIILTNGGGRVQFDNPRSFGVTLRYHTGVLQ